MGERRPIWACIGYSCSCRQLPDHPASFACADRHQVRRRPTHAELCNISTSRQKPARAATNIPTACSPHANWRDSSDAPSGTFSISESAACPPIGSARSSASISIKFASGWIPMAKPRPQTRVCSNSRMSRSAVTMTTRNAPPLIWRASRPEAFRLRFAPRTPGRRHH